MAVRTHKSGKNMYQQRLQTLKCVTFSWHSDINVNLKQLVKGNKTLMKWIGHIW